MAMKYGGGHGDGYPSYYPSLKQQRDFDHQQASALPVSHSVDETAAEIRQRIRSGGGMKKSKKENVLNKTNLHNCRRYLSI